MVTGGGNPIFIDTNILVYANQIQSPFHQAAIEAIQGLYDGGVELWISRQVLREYLAILSRPQQFTIAPPIALVLQNVRYFQNRFLVAEDSSNSNRKITHINGDNFYRW